MDRKVRWESEYIIPWCIVIKTNVEQYHCIQN